MKNNYRKDTIFDKRNEHFVHLDPSSNELKKILKMEGPQRILILLYKDNLLTCTKAYENTHFDMYNTLYDNNYIKTDYNNFAFLIETKQFFGGSIVYDKQTQLDDNPLSLYCKNFNLYIIDGVYSTCEQAAEFYNLLPDKLKLLLGELNIEECKYNLESKSIRNNKDENFATYLKNKPEKDIFLKQVFGYIKNIDELLQEKDVNIDKIKLYIKMAIELYKNYKKKY